MGYRKLKPADQPRRRRKTSDVKFTGDVTGMKRITIGKLTVYVRDAAHEKQVRKKFADHEAREEKSFKSYAKKPPTELSESQYQKNKVKQQKRAVNKRENFF